MDRHKWLVKITLLTQDSKISVVEISILNHSEARKELEKLQLSAHVLRRLIEFGRTRYNDKNHTVKLKWFYSVTPHTPPTGEVYEWLLNTNALIRVVNKRDV